MFGGGIAQVFGKQRLQSARTGREEIFDFFQNSQRFRMA
jgi:hypothetical protein